MALEPMISTSLQPLTSAGLVALSAEARKLAAASPADTTKRAYSSDWADFTAWCDRDGREPLPADPHTLADYIAALASPPRNLKVSTINRRCSAIAREHRLANHPSPLRGTARETLAGLRQLVRVEGWLMEPENS